MDVKYLEKTRSPREVYIYLDKYNIRNNKLHLKESSKVKFYFISADYFTEKLYDRFSCADVYNLNEWLKYRRFYKLSPFYYFKIILGEI